MSKFVMSSELSSDTLEWGTIGWISNPPSTGNSHLAAATVTLLPGCGHDFHRHTEQEEVIVVRSGVVEQWIGKEKRLLKAGDAVYIDPNTIHASFNAGEDVVELFVVLGPCIGESGYAIEEVADQEPWSNIRSK